MSVILPLACKTCGRRVDLPSDQPMPRCPDCSGQMRPAGRIQEKAVVKDMFNEEVHQVEDEPVSAMSDWEGLLLNKHGLIKEPNDLIRYAKPVDEVTNDEWRSLTTTITVPNAILQQPSLCGFPIVTLPKEEFEKKYGIIESLVTGNVFLQTITIDGNTSMTFLPPVMQMDDSCYVDREADAAKENKSLSWLDDPTGAITPTPPLQIISSKVSSWGTCSAFDKNRLSKEVILHLNRLPDMGNFNDVDLLMSAKKQTLLDYPDGFVSKLWSMVVMDCDVKFTIEVVMLSEIK